MRGYAGRTEAIEPFRVVKILTRAMELEASGRDILHLEAGEPDFDTAAPVCDAGVKALREGRTHYTPAGGIPALREAIARYYQTDYGLDIAPERILVTPGGSGALLLIAALLLNPGDGMLMADPGYPCNRHFMRLVEGHGQLVAVTADERYQLQAERAAEAWQDNTIGALVASPANPTGGILRTDELAALYDLVEVHNGWLVVDEIYHGLDYDERAPSILSITDRAFVVNSFSKYFGMTGWRLGWLVAPADAVAEMEKMAQNLFISMSAPAQYAALACFEPVTREILDCRRDTFRQRRDFLLPALRELGFRIPYRPAGGLYLYADVSNFTDDSERFCFDLLEQHGIAITPGSDFGSYRAREHVRFAYTTTMAALDRTVERLQQVLGQW